MFLHRTYCYCGDTPGIRKSSENYCPAACPGNSEEFCGGTVYSSGSQYSNSVYGTGL